MSQLHKRFTSQQVKELLDRYAKNEIERKCIQEILKIKRRRFFVHSNLYKENPWSAPQKLDKIWKSEENDHLEKIGEINQ